MGGGKSRAELIKQTRPWRRNDVVNAAPERHLRGESGFRA
jgi:hypothetical protein